MAASVLEVLITGDATSLKLAFTQATAATEEYAAATASSSAATKEASATATAFGGAANRAMTYAKLGALAFAAVSVKAAIDFNREFTLIAAVTNTAADRIDALKSTVMDLSRTTGVAPEELAHAMYFLASAGLTTTQQMSALTEVAKGTAIGLGSAGDLARIEANALNAFADQGLTATQVMDGLTAAVKAGTAEPDEFAAALGRVLPVADQAGISFQSVIASLSAMSNAGLDVQEGVTSLRATLQSLVAPTAQTTSAFATMGLTVTDVVASMQGQGYIATLRMVSDAAKKATDSQGAYNQLMRHAIPNIRGLVGALNLTHQEAAKVDEVFREVSQSIGATDKAFQTTAQSSAFKVTQAFNDIKIAGMTLASDVLPFLAKGLELVANHAEAVLTTLLGYAALRFVAPMLKDIAVANAEVAASEVAVESAQASMAGMNFAGMTQFGAMGASSSVALRELQVEAAGTTTALTATAASTTGLTSRLMTLGNTLGESGIPQVLALVNALRDAKNEIDAFTSGGGITGAIQSAIGSGTVGMFMNFLPGGGAINNFLKSITGPSQDQVQHFKDGLQAVQDSLAATALTSQQKTDIINQAMASIGGNLSVDNIDQYVSAVNNQLDAQAQQKAQAQAAAAAQLDLTKQIQATAEASKSWQENTAAMTDHLSGLARIGINVTDFMSQLKSDLASSTDQTKTFSDAIGTITKAWDDFKNQAQQALFFIPKALDDLTSSAQSAQDQLDSMTKSSTATNSEVAALRSTANLTGADILHSFQQANAESRTFFLNLKEIASHGSAGKDLAASLLQSGNTMAAAAISGSKFETQILHTFGTGEKMANKFATTLTDAIVGPLDDITKILAKIGQSLGVKGLNIYLNDHGVKKGLQDRKKQAEELAHQNYKVQLGLQDDASKGIHGVQGDVDHLVGNVHKVQLGVNSDLAKRQLANFDSTLNTFLSKKRQINIGVHTHPSSPWPDEALKQHLGDPLKTMGFTKVGDAWTLPLKVGTHTDPTTFPGGTAPKNAKDAQRKAAAGLGELKQVEMRQLQVLFDIRRELKHVGGTGGSGTGSSSSTGGTSTGSSGSSSGTSSSAFSNDLQHQLKDMGLYISSVQSKAASKKWASAITDAINNGDMTKEIKLLHQAMRDMAQVTGQNPAERAFHQFQGAVQQFEQAQHKAQFKQFMADALAYATHNVPRLPKGHTNISVNHHERHGSGWQHRVTLDRKRFTDSASYEVDYARGF